MTDVSRALLLPDLRPPMDAVLRSLALYWDDFVVPEYLERYFEEAPSPIAESATLSRLREEGIALVAERRVDLSELLPMSQRTASERKLVSLAPTKELVEELIEKCSDFGPFGVVVTDNSGKERELRLTEDDLLDVVAAQVAQHLVTRLDDATSLAKRENLAPVACSRVSHLASMLGAPSPDAPLQEAALLAVAVAAFEINPDTPLDEVLRFRETSRAARGRFRSALGDLAEGLRGDADPALLLAQARDRYRNRVVPRLAELEDILKENGLMFMWRSLTRTTAVALGPVKPVRAAEAGASIVAESLNYAWSKKKLIREHPYGFLHDLGDEMGTFRDPSPELMTGDGEGLAALRRLIRTADIRAALNFLGEYRPGI